MICISHCTGAYIPHVSNGRVELLVVLEHQRPERFWDERSDIHTGHEVVELL